MRNGEHVMRKKKQLWKIILGGVSFILLLILINFIPTWNLKTKGMEKLEGKYLDVYYETEEEAAKDVFWLAEAKAGELTERLGFTEKQAVRIFIYDHQKTMQTKKYGFLGPLLGLDWYIGDNIGTDVILTSPANPGKVHSYENNKEAVLHEMVHAYVSVINPNIHLWLTEGMALYLSNGQPFYKAYLEELEIPKYSDLQTKNPMKFEECNGYLFASTYIEFLDVTYGWDNVLELLKKEEYQKVYGKTEQELYKEWVSYLMNYNQ